MGGTEWLTVMKGWSSSIRISKLYMYGQHRHAMYNNLSKSQKLQTYKPSTLIYKVSVNLYVNVTAMGQGDLDHAEAIWLAKTMIR